MDTVAVGTPSHSQFAAGSRGPRQGTACPHRGGNCKSQATFQVGASFEYPPKEDIALKIALAMS